MGRNYLLLFISTKGSDIYINHSPLNNNSISIFLCFYCTIYFEFLNFIYDRQIECEKICSQKRTNVQS